MTNLDSVLKNRDVTDRGPSSQSYGFSSSRVWMWELDYKESWALKNSCLWTVVLEKTLESPLDCKEIQPVHPKGDQSWIFIGRTDAEAETPNTWATWCKELTHLKRLWCWERLKVGGKGDDRGWDGWMASPTWWMWVWARSGTRWRTGKPAVLQSMGSQRVGHDWATELNWTCWVVAFSCSVAQLCPTLCHPMDCSTLGSLSFSIYQSLLKLLCVEFVMPSNHFEVVVLKKLLKPHWVSTKGLCDLPYVTMWKVSMKARYLWSFKERSEYTIDIFPLVIETVNSQHLTVTRSFLRIYFVSVTATKIILSEL